MFLPALVVTSPKTFKCSLIGYARIKGKITTNNVLPNYLFWASLFGLLLPLFTLIILSLLSTWHYLHFLALIALKHASS